jgi:hypothetical protein
MYHYNYLLKIKIIRERVIEQIVFPVPTICEYLTKETKQRVFLTTEKDDQNSKITGFFGSVDIMWNEMKWQRKLRQQVWLYWFSSQMSLWSDVSFILSLIINFLVGIFYPFDGGINELNFKSNAFLWIIMLISIVFLVASRKKWTIRFFLITCVVRLVYLIGVQPTLQVVGLINIINKLVFLISYMGNKGLFTLSSESVHFEFLYHLSYLIFCILGFTGHEFFFSLLLLDVVYREETLLNVIRCVTKNAKSVLLTAIFAVILIYLFSICGYVFLQNDFIMGVSPPLIGNPFFFISINYQIINIKFFLLRF